MSWNLLDVSVRLLLFGCLATRLLWPRDGKEAQNVGSSKNVRLDLTIKYHQSINQSVLLYGALKSHIVLFDTGHVLWDEAKTDAPNSGRLGDSWGKNKDFLSLTVFLLRTKCDYHKKLILVRSYGRSYWLLQITKPSYAWCTLPTLKKRQIYTSENKQPKRKTNQILTCILIPVGCSIFSPVGFFSLHLKRRLVLR